VVSFATAIACLAAVATGCDGPSVLQSPDAPAAFAISYKRSGGLEATPRKLTIKPGRHAVVSAGAPNGTHNRAVRFQVTAKRIRSLRRGLARAHFAAIESTTPSGSCADCYLYSIRYRGHEVVLLQTDVPARLHRVIDQLEAVIAAHAYPPPR
jgi:hypothetical protein